MNTVNIVTVVDSNWRSLLICFTRTHFIKTKTFILYGNANNTTSFDSSFNMRTFTQNTKSILRDPIEMINRIKIFTKLILYQIRKYQGIMVLLISLNIDCLHGTDLRLIFKNRCVRFMTDFKMVTSKGVPS